MPLATLAAALLLAAAPLAAGKARKAAASTDAAVLGSGGLPVATPDDWARAGMHCLGSVYWARTCLFYNVVFDTQTKRFQYFGKAGDSPEMHAIDHPTPSKPWIRMSMCAPVIVHVHVRPCDSACPCAPL